MFLSAQGTLSLLYPKMLSARQGSILMCCMSLLSEVTSLCARVSEVLLLAQFLMRIRWTYTGRPCLVS